MKALRILIKVMFFTILSFTVFFYCSCAITSYQTVSGEIQVVKYTDDGIAEYLYIIENGDIKEQITGLVWELNVKNAKIHKVNLATLVMEDITEIQVTNYKLSGYLKKEIHLPVGSLWNC